MRRIAELVVAPIAVGLMLAAVFVARTAHAVTATWVAGGTTTLLSLSDKWTGSPMVTFLAGGTNTDLVFSTAGRLVHLPDNDAEAVAPSTIPRHCLAGSDLSPPLKKARAMTPYTPK